MSRRVGEGADDPRGKDKPVAILHAVYPRDERGSYGNTNREASWASCYVEVQEKKLTTAKAIAEAKKLIETNTRRF